MKKDKALQIILFVFLIGLFSCSSQFEQEYNGSQVDSTQMKLQSGLGLEKTNDSSKTQSDKLREIYIQAISDYLHAVNNHFNLVYDTLFFGKHVYGQEDDFPDIELPSEINQTVIKLVDPELGAQLQDEKMSRVYINLVGFADSTKAEFIFVTFSNGMNHQFDCFINYTNQQKLEGFKLKDICLEDNRLNQAGKNERIVIYQDGKYVRNKLLKQ